MNTLVVLALVYFAAAHAGDVQVVDKWAPAHYKFDYGVEDAHTGDKKSQTEIREGDVVKGQYSLKEPDGTIRVVEYTADPHNGFNAVVKRIGHAAHPQVVHKAVVSAPVISHSVAAPVVVSGHGGWSGVNGGWNNGWSGVNRGWNGGNGAWGGWSNQGWNNGWNNGWNGARRW